MLKKAQLRLKRRKSIRKKISGTAIKPRVSVFRSNKYLYVQVIDDEKSNTLVATNSKVVALDQIPGVLFDVMSKKGIDQVVFDRSGYKYHGNIKSIAEGLRDKGIKF